MMASPGDIAVTHCTQGGHCKKTIPLYLHVSKRPVLPNMFFLLVLL